jgi:sporulation protein YlmC with PRC-barrel domain
MWTKGHSMTKPEKVLANELLQCEVLDLAAGKVIGNVQDLALTLDGRIVAVGVLPRAWYTGGLGISPASIISIQQQRVCIESQDVLTEFRPDKKSFSMYENGLLASKRVLKQNGEMLGQLMDFSFELASGRITELIVLGENERRSKVAVDCIRAIGPEYLVVGQAEVTDAPSAAMDNPAVNKDNPNPASSFQEVPPELEEAPPPAMSSADQPAGELFGGSKEESDLSAFDEKKRKFLLGRPAHRDIKTAEGEMIIAKGESISETAFEGIINAGLLGEVFIEMTLKK